MDINTQEISRGQSNGLMSKKGFDYLKILVKECIYVHVYDLGYHLGLNPKFTPCEFATWDPMTNSHLSSFSLEVYFLLSYFFPTN